MLLSPQSIVSGTTDHRFESVSYQHEGGVVSLLNMSYLTWRLLALLLALAECKTIGSFERLWI